MWLHLMKKKLVLLPILLFVIHAVTGQRQWAWMAGDQSVNINRVYGTPGMAHPSNNPGSRAGAAFWTDKQGKFYLFGGQVNDGTTGGGLLNDLWKYDPDTGWWAWIGGDKNTHSRGTYEHKGEAAAGNTPGARQNAVSWTDDNGNFWLFSGWGHPANDDDDNGEQPGYLNDLWMFSPVTGLWNFISGTDKKNREGKYGSHTELSPSNYPGGRYSANGWYDNNGNLWLFGGRGFSSRDEISQLGDVWKYSIADNSWAWMKGDYEGRDDVAYGTRGNFDDSNTPGGRHGSVSWTDNNNDFWLFGGGTQSDLFGDLWKYDRVNNRWAWISGSNLPNTNPQPGDIGVFNANVNPGARTLFAVWVDDINQVWFFGGNGYGDNTGSKPLNSLWIYSITRNQWAFMKGDVSANAPAVFGTKEVGAADNTPGGMANPSYWKDLQGDFWVFGGRSQQGYLNQVWKLSPDCAGDISGNITPAFSTICEGGSQVLTATGGTSYEWKFNDASIPGETNDHLTVTEPGTYSVTITNGTCSRDASNTAVVTLSSVAGLRYTDVNVTANTPARLSARPIGETYEWTPVTGLNNPNSPEPMVTITESIQYTVMIRPDQGCTIIDTVLVKVLAADNKIFVPTAFTPNGNNVNDRLRPVSGLSRIHTFRVYNRWGNLVYQTSEIGAGWDGTHKGVLQPADTYTWFLTGISLSGEQVKLSGNTLLIR